MQLKFTKLIALAVSLAITGAVSAPLIDEGLDAKFKAAGKKYFGTAMRLWDQLTEEEIALTKQEFGQVTPEHALTWDFTERTQGVFDLSLADKVFEWATSNGKLARGQALVWHSQTPMWVHRIDDKAVLTEVIENHVTTIVSRYAGQVYAQWDVVGEPFEDNGVLRNTVFARVLGPDFITVAFKAARKADPKAKLYIYDYGLEKLNAKVDAMVALVSKLNTENPGLIDGIAPEAHLGILQNDPAPAEGLEEALTALSKAEGITEVALTELCSPYAVPEDYVQAVQACLNVEKCVGVTVWGVSDAHSWRSRLAPLLFDGKLNKKPAYDAVVEALSV